MDPYIPHCSQPVFVDSVATRKSRQQRTVMLVLAIILSLGALVLTDYAFAQDPDGEVIIYREVPKRSAVRESYPEAPVSVQTGSSSQYSGVISDSALAGISVGEAPIGKQISSMTGSPLSSLPGTATHTRSSTSIMGNGFQSNFLSGVVGTIAGTAGGIGNGTGPGNGLMHSAPAGRVHIPAVLPAAGK